VRLIDADGQNHGVVPLNQAMQAAEEAGLDLVEVSPTSKPPVCKVLDFGRYKYEMQKRKAEARKKQKTVDVKEVKIRPNIEDHDYNVKIKNIQKFLGEGDRVKVSLRFRGREMAHQDLGQKILNKVRDDVADTGKIEADPKLEGRQMIMVLAPR
jgi:translation initiation factor IF-3